MTKRILNGLRKAAHILAISEATRSELLQYGIATPQQVTVISLGVHPAFSPLPETSADEEAARLLPQKTKSQVLLLAVANNMARKRLDVLLQVFAAVRRTFPEALLVRVGGPFTPSHERLAEQLGVRSQITTLPHLTTEVLGAVYRRSAMLLQTTEAEGFGLPVIEAMACGCPVVASDIPVLREVGAEAVKFCRVADVPGWVGSVGQLLEERQSRASEWALRRQRGLERASKFTWTENARKTAQVYRKVLKAGGRN
jgi:glycosyltransferase involved in cell wall biosynthesis